MTFSLHSHSPVMLLHVRLELPLILQLHSVETVKMHEYGVTEEILGVSEYTHRYTVQLNRATLVFIQNSSVEILCYRIRHKNKHFILIRVPGGCVHYGYIHL